MNLYRVQQYDPDRPRQAIEREHKLAWDAAKQDVKTISVLGICTCIGLCIYVAFIAF